MLPGITPGFVLQTCIIVVKDDCTTKSFIPEKRDDIYYFLSDTVRLQRVSKTCGSNMVTLLTVT